MKQTTVKEIKKTSRETLPLPKNKVVPNKKFEQLEKIKKSDKG